MTGVRRPYKTEQTCLSIQSTKHPHSHSRLSCPPRDCVIGLGPPRSASRGARSCSCGLTRAVRHAAGDNRQPKRYIPFAEGPRNCVGQSLAKVSLVATMALLLARFSFKLADDVSPPPP